MTENEQIAVTRLRLPLSKKDIQNLGKLQTALYYEKSRLSRRNLEAAVRSRNTVIYVARNEEGRIVAKGTVCLSRDELGVAARLENIVVLRDYRRLGLMTRILNELLMYAMERKPYIVHLTSHPLRKAAYAFYKRYGFVDSGCKVLLFPT